MIKKNKYGLGHHSIARQAEVFLIFGSLPAEVKAEQMRRFNRSKGLNVLVATDAIGMGMNLDIKRVIFTTFTKPTGMGSTRLTNTDIQQIAGRAGRNTQNGLATAILPSMLDILEQALADKSVHTLQPSLNHATPPLYLLPPVALLNDIADSLYLSTGNYCHLADIHA
jgi:ATP-dependent RNA helicase SUPV3L1/SUV3